MTHKYALPEPKGIETAPEDGTVIELARVWIGPGEPSILVRPAFEDPKAMGEMLAELCWHFSLAYEQQGGGKAADIREQLKEGWASGHANGEAELLRRAGQQ